MKFSLVLLFSLLLAVHSSDVSLSKEIAGENAHLIPSEKAREVPLLTDTDIQSMFGRRRRGSIARDASASLSLSADSITADNVDVARDVCHALRRTAAELDGLAARTPGSGFARFISRIRIIIIWWDWIIIIIIRRIN